MSRAASAATPMFQQYHRAKAEHRDAILMFRMGDFYEMFNEDAKLAARELGISRDILRHRVKLYGLQKPN